MMVYLRGVTGSKDAARQAERDAVREYVEEHPGCSTREVARDVMRAPEEGGLELRALAHRRLRELEEAGLVRHEKSSRGRGHGHPHRWWIVKSPGG